MSDAPTTGGAIKKAVFELMTVTRNGEESLKDGLLAFTRKERLNQSLPIQLFSLNPTREGEFKS
jgi:hypothetical protein